MDRASSPRSPGPDPAGLSRSTRRRLLITTFVIVSVLAGAAYLLDALASTPGREAVAVPAVEESPPPPARTPPVPATTPPSPTPTPAPPGPADLPALPGEVPIDGPGTFRYADEQGEVLGESGPVWRFRVAIEEGVDEELAAFVEFIDDTLGAAEGWTAGGDRRFQRVPGDGTYDFTIYLATSGTAARKCATAGLDIIGNGWLEGGVSCRAFDEVVLNLHRWWRSVPDFVEDEVPLLIYRQMLLNHEVGHQLGHGHEGCPGPGEPAPVMQQQTLSLNGCRPYPWPYRDGVRYTGPWVP